jgi:hypothetical protein
MQHERGGAGTGASSAARARTLAYELEGAALQVDAEQHCMMLSGRNAGNATPITEGLELS